MSVPTPTLEFGAVIDGSITWTNWIVEPNVRAKCLAYSTATPETAVKSVTKRILLCVGHHTVDDEVSLLLTKKGDRTLTVINDLSVQMEMEDERIRENVIRHIAWQPEIESKYISVKVMNGEVKLTGFVHHYLDKSIAERAAKLVRGVISIANDIEVKPKDQKTDPEIVHDVVEALRLHSHVPDNRLIVHVRDGVVTLEGALPWHFQRESAELAAQAVAGVRDVVNLIVIEPAVHPQEVLRKIEDTWRHTIDLDANRMSVTRPSSPSPVRSILVARIRQGGISPVHQSTMEGSVTLDGRVHSLSEREQAERAAWQVPGVREVVNHLMVTP
jgi:osmotically-inducible protein OsmY